MKTFFARIGQFFTRLGAMDDCVLSPAAPAETGGPLAAIRHLSESTKKQVHDLTFFQLKKAFDHRFALLLLLTASFWSVVMLELLGVINYHQGRLGFLILLVTAGLNFLAAVLIAEWMGVKHLFTIDEEPLNATEKTHPYLPYTRHIALTVLLTAAIPISLYQLSLPATATTPFHYTEQRAWQIANDAQASDDTMVGYWKFDETTGGSTAVDASGDGNDGTPTGAGGANNKPQPSTDVPTTSFSNGRSLSFDGTDDHVNISSPPGNYINGTIAAWVKPTTLTGGSNCNSHNTSGSCRAIAFSDDYGYFFAINSDGALILDLGDGSSAWSVTDNTQAAVVSAGAWQHVVVSLEGTTVKYYANGTLQDTNTVAANSGLQLGSNDRLGIGGNALSNGFAFSGLIDDVRIYSRVLSASEISDLAAGRHTAATWDGSSSTNFQTGVNWDTNAAPDPYTRITVPVTTSKPVFTTAVSLAGLTINTGALLKLDGQSLTMNDAGTFTNYGTLAIKGSETLTSFTNDTSKGTVLVYGTGSYTGLPTGTSYKHLNLNDGLVGYWKLDETSGIRAADSSGYSNSGTLVGGPTISSTVAPVNFTNARSLSFDGTDDYVSAASASPFNFGIGPFTVATWVRGANFGNGNAHAMVNTNNNDGGTDQGFSLRVGNGVGASDKLYAFLNGGLNVSGITSLAPNAWYHAVLVRNGDNLTLYLNGQQDGTASGVAAANVTSLISPKMGAVTGANGNLHFLSGNIDDVRIYNRALSPAEIAALAAGNQPSASKATVTLNGALTINGDLTLNGGTLDTSSSNYGISVGGSWLNNGGIFTSRGSTITFNGTTSGKSILSGGLPFNKVTINGSGGGWTLADRLTSSGALAIAAGTLDVSTSNYTVKAGTLNQTGGTFTARSGKVVLTASSAQTLRAVDTLSTLRIEDPTENGLVGYWKFDEGTNSGAILDSSGNGNTGVRRGGAGLIWTGSTLPNLAFDNPFAMKFDGSDDRVDVAGVSVSTPYTIAGWVRPNASADTAYAVLLTQGTTKGLYFRGSNGKLNMFDGGADHLSSAGLSFGQWYHVSAVVNSTDVTFYIDGQLDSTVAGTFGAMAFTRIGEDGAMDQFAGEMDDLRIYSRALPANEVANLARGRYASGGSSTATFTLGANLSAGTIVLDSGNLAASTFTITATNALTLVRGNGSLTLGSGLVTLNGGLTLSGSTLTGGAGTLSVNGALQILTGSLIAPSGRLNVTGDWTKKGGTFTANGGTVALTGSNQTMTGSTTFYNLTATGSSARTLTFAATTTQTVAGVLILQGEADDLLSLRSSQTGTQWKIDPQGSRTVEYLDVKDSNNINAAFMSAAGHNITDSGNNTNWQIANPEVSFQSGALTLSESAGQVTLNITLSGSSLQDITIPYSLGGTATGTGADYTQITQSPLILEAGETSTGVILSVIDDGEVESDETIIFTLGSPTNSVVGSTGSLTITLTSDDVAPSVSSSASASSEAPRPSGGGSRGSPAAMTAKIKAAQVAILARYNNALAVARASSSSSSSSSEGILRSIARRLLRQRSSSAASALSSAASSSEQTVVLQPSSSSSVTSSAGSSRIRSASSSSVPSVSSSRSSSAAAIAIRLSSSAKPLELATLPAIAERRGLLLTIIDNSEVLYKDVQTTAWYAPYVADLITTGVAQGYRDSQGNLKGEFGVEKPVTRAEVLKMALEAAGKKPAIGTPRNLSAKGSWAAGYVKAAEDLQLTVFTPDTDINKPASRGEVVQIILEVMGIPTAIKLPPPFTDVSPSHPYANGITVAAAYGIVEGDKGSDGKPLNRFRPNDPINRAEVAKIVALVKEVLR